MLCLAFPLEPPRRSGPRPSRLDELDAVTVPTLVVQGVRDPFGMPPKGEQRTVVQVQGDHSLRTDLASVGAAVSAWLARTRLPTRPSATAHARARAGRAGLAAAASSAAPDRDRTARVNSVDARTACLHAEASSRSTCRVAGVSVPAATTMLRQPARSV